MTVLTAKLAVQSDAEWSAEASMHPRMHTFVADTWCAVLCHMFQIWHNCCTAGIQHPDAGDGLFLQGSAPVGALVALYPGLVYEPMHYR